MQAPSTLQKLNVPKRKAPLPCKIEQFQRARPSLPLKIVKFQSARPLYPAKMLSSKSQDPSTPQKCNVPKGKAPPTPQDVKAKKKIKTIKQGAAFRHKVKFVLHPLPAKKKKRFSTVWHRLWKKHVKPNYAPLPHKNLKFQSARLLYPTKT